MIVRYVMAAIGGSLITVAMLLGMNQIAQKFQERDPTRYFSIVDFVALPKDRRPTRPPAPSMPPERPQIEVHLPRGSTLPVQVPSVDDARVVPPPLIPEPIPNLSRSEPARDQ